MYNDALKRNHNWIKMFESELKYQILRKYPTGMMHNSQCYWHGFDYIRQFLFNTGKFKLDTYLAEDGCVVIAFPLDIMTLRRMLNPTRPTDRKMDLTFKIEKYLVDIHSDLGRDVIRGYIDDPESFINSKYMQEIRDMFMNVNSINPIGHLIEGQYPKYRRNSLPLVILDFEKNNLSYIYDRHPSSYRQGRDNTSIKNFYNTYGVADVINNIPWDFVEFEGISIEGNEKLLLMRGEG